MILEGFEIENWSCIRKVVVENLPATGVTVLHGPNGTGKSSIVAAIRACLMDFNSPSTAKELRRWYPKNSSEKPRVTVTFRVQGTSWRIFKQFGTRESKLESRSATGIWRLEKSTASDAHDHLRGLLGNKDSDAGLHQLLWLTQAEFRLPLPRAFDSDLQSQLRAVLGVLQTPLDDRFISRVKEKWSNWFAINRKPGSELEYKPHCKLKQSLNQLQILVKESARIEEEYRKFEQLEERHQILDREVRSLREDVAARQSQWNTHQQEYEQSLQRLQAHELAFERVRTAEKKMLDAGEAVQRIQDVESRLHSAEIAVAKTSREVEDCGLRLVSAETRLLERRQALQKLSDSQRSIQSQLDKLNELREFRNLTDTVDRALASLQQVEQLSIEKDAIQKLNVEHPAPTASQLTILEENRSKCNQLRANLAAAANTIIIKLEPGALLPQITIDGVISTDDQTVAPKKHLLRRQVRRTAEVTIPGWGRVEFQCGSDSRSLEQLEKEANELDREFADALALYGISATQTGAIDRLHTLAAEKKTRDPELKRLGREIERLAPQGIELLRKEAAQLVNLLNAKKLTDLQASDINLDQLEIETQRYRQLFAQNQSEIAAIEKEIAILENAIDGPAKKSASRSSSTLSLRQQEATAREALASLKASVKIHQEERDRLPTFAQSQAIMEESKIAVHEARITLLASSLSESEVTIKARLDAAKAGLLATQHRLESLERDCVRCETELALAAGLHPRRAEATARVEELKRNTDREILEARSYDRLYQLFEESRERQFDTLMEPIQRRILHWIQLLRIKGYQSIRFNEQLLPDKLLAGHDATEISIDEESTGTLEQIGLMVRLALGSILSKPDEPVCAVLDDPLTHSDIARLDRMRTVLHDASEGNPNSMPPAGPLQILIFTCHPEWFNRLDTRSIDLSSPELLERNR